ncbi:MAG: hypothetical protein Q8P51_14610 [Ignavibacteria bacterium]|nr:hypothetical protein [Ignavibacteria bacterium]
MMEERYVESMNKEIDGLNTPSESHDLQKYLNSTSEAKKFFDDLQRTVKALQGVEEKEPPSYLRNHILNSIKFEPTTRASQSGWIGQLAETFQSRSFRRYALVFVSGLCVGILFFVFANPWREKLTDTTKLSGSMALFPDLSHLQVVDSVHIESEGIDGAFKTYWNEGRVFVEIEVKSPEHVRVELNSDPDELVFGSIGRLAGTEGDVNVTQGKIIFTGVNSDRSIVTFSEVGYAQRPIEGRIYKGDSLVRSVTLKAH